MADYTNFYVDYALDNNDAQNDATMTATEYKPMSRIDLLPEGTEATKFISQEHNYVVLDGTYTDTPGSIAFISEEMSDENGLFTDNPTITATFTRQHKSFMLTFKFVEDAPTKVRVCWWLDSEIIYGMTQEWDGNETTCTVTHAIEAFDKLTIEFMQALPKRYIKLNRIEFGTTLHWDETIVKSATLVKGLNRLSDMLSIDTLNIELVDTSNIMNFANPMGVHTMFKRDQAMYPIEILQDEGRAPETLPLGKFFLDTFTTEGNIGRISAYSYMGILDRIPYNGGGVYNGTLASVVLADIFAAAGLSAGDYSIDSETANQQLYGVIKPTTCREALRQVLFACNSIVNTSHEQHIKVSKYSTGVIKDITRHNKTSTKVSSIEFVSGVKLSYTTYSLGSESTQITSGVFSVGSHTVSFDKPYTGLTITGGTIESSDAFSVTFSSDGTTTITVSGTPYEETSSYVALNKEVVSGEVENVIEYSTTLCNMDTATELAEKLLDYHKNNLRLQIQHYASNVTMDNSRFVENPNSDLDGFIAMFESRSIDLTGGFFDSATMVGKYDVSDRYYYAGKKNAEDSIVELYAGEDGIV